MVQKFSLPITFEPDEYPKKLKIEYASVIQGKITLITSFYNKKESASTLNAISYNADGSIDKTWHEITTLSVENNNDLGDYHIELSADRKNLLIAVNLPDNENDETLYHVFVLNEDLSQNWTKEIRIPHSSKLTEVYDFTVDNKGTMHLLAKVKPASKQEKREAKGENEDPDNHLLISFNNGLARPRILKLQSHNKTILQAALRVDPNENLIVSGFYNDNSTELNGPEGTFFTRVGIEIQVDPTLITSRISDTITTRMIPRNFNSQVPQFDIGNNFILNNWIPTSDGGIILVAEEYIIKERCRTDASTGAVNCTYSYLYNDILTIRLNEDGGIMWSTIIYKRSSGKLDDENLSYSAFLKNDQLHLQFLDSKENFSDNSTRTKSKGVQFVSVNNGVAVTALIDNTGSPSYKILYDVEEDQFAMQPHLAFSFNQDYLLVYSAPKKKNIIRLGRIKY